MIPNGNAPQHALTMVADMQLQAQCFIANGTCNFPYGTGHE